MLIAEKISLFLITWIFFIILITPDSQIEIFLILLLIGFVIAKEISNPFLISTIKKRINMFILIFLVIFSAVIVNRILILFPFQ